MTKLLEILKRKIYLSKITKSNDEIYFIDIDSHQITEEEYNLIKEFLERQEEENE
jgi:hypothetical protein